jgi:hypothetical protein
MFPGYQIAMLVVAVLVAIVFAAFQEGTFTNAVFFGKCGERWAGPKACDPQPYQPPPLG